MGHYIMYTVMSVMHIYLNIAVSPPHLDWGMNHDHDESSIVQIFALHCCSIS